MRRPGPAGASGPRVRLRAEAGTPLVLRAARALPARPSGCSGNSRCCVGVAALTCAPLGTHTRGPCLLRGSPWGSPGCGGGGSCSIWSPPPMQLRPPPDSGEGRPKTVSISTGDTTGTWRESHGISSELASPPPSCGPGLVTLRPQPPANRGCGPKQAQLVGAWRRGSQPLWCKQEGCDWFWL